MTLRAGGALLVLVPLLLAGAPRASAGEVTVHAVASGRAIAVESPTPWIEGGFGRISEGSDTVDFEAHARGEAHAGLDWSPVPTLLLRLSATARTEPGAAGGWRAGLAEAFLQYRPELRADLALRLRAGLFFPPTSLENVEPLWQSPYTITLSAVNSWVGEELRLVGLDAAAQVGSHGGSRLEVAGAAFGGSDTAGALLAWRGFAMGTRLSVAGEVVPLPLLPTLAPGGAFADQRDDGTRPVDELDGRVGWHGRARWSLPGRGLVQASWTDNRGDRGLHRGQYAWATRFASIGAEVEAGAFRLVTEGVLGDTGMGQPEGARVDARFRAGYALVSWASGGEAVRLTARYDRFRNDDRDGQPEPNDESGHAFTLAAFFFPRPRVRVGAEYVELRSDRPAAAFSGSSASTDARRAQAELRLVF